MGSAHKIRTVVVATLVATLTGGMASAAAEPPAAEAVQGSLMFVLDASGSMTAPTGGGGTRMETAKAAMGTLVDQLPINIDVGLQVYGTATGNTPAEKEAGCADVRTLRPVSEVDRAALHADVAGIQPRGYTPIGTALTKAAEALPERGPRAVVLLSDGVDTCAPPEPCAVAEELAGDKVELAMHTVGFQVDEAARDELDCIAEETGGAYHHVPEAGDLEDLLPEIADRALRSYEVTGENVAGSEQPDEDAPYLRPGQYEDRIDRATPHYYRVHVPAGVTGRYTAVHTVRKDRSRVESGVDLRLVDGQLRECARARGYRDYNFDGPETASVTWSATPRTRCDPRGPHYLEVTWDNAKRRSSDNIELTVSLEPAARGDHGPGPESGPVPWREPAGEPGIVWGGGSFRNAAPLPGSGRYVDKLNYSEYSIYKVWLDWGQGLAYRLRVRGGERGNAATVATELRDPTRAPARKQWWRSADHDGDEVTLGPVGTARVRYANREGNQPASSSTRAGWYYIVAKLSPVWERPKSTPEELPTFELQVHVTGQAEPGPDYPELTVPEEPPPGPADPADWQPEPLAAHTEPQRAEVPWPWWAAGGGVLLLGMLGTLWWLRLRRVSGA
ncbi:vWA domain-containing protein [Amycolatopsis cihanbeyliensis]|uniref:Ca-activated chloride channel family protein n=1 Tax=Amycolatopsis cihanbeyliensis TaxID=1128664 RepID=A0A542DKQ2_AMYCI|nr:VWA domain-containing protein [Amycolatopsis cihanbeyliensis]TQJ03658.1 Ca-activated chloride channel family protein [Amycolatopsis cihanbeyliensis]